MDTIPGFSGKNVNPQIIENYDGNTIKLNGIELITFCSTFVYKIYNN